MANYYAPNYNQQQRNGQWQGTPFLGQPKFQPVNYGPAPMPKKRSGAKTKKYTPKEGPNAGVEMVHTHGWMFRKNEGLTTFSCNTTQKSKLNKETGWIGSIAIEILNHRTHQKTFAWGCMDYKTGKVVVNDHAIVVNPRAKNGGYCGTFLKK